MSKKLSKEMALAWRIRQMKKGDTFPIVNEQDRRMVCGIIKTLRDAEVLEAEIKTFADGEKFKCVAI